MLCFCVLLVAMVLLSPHAVPVVSSLWIRVLVRDAHSLPLPRRWIPGVCGSALSLDVQEVQCSTVSQPGHRKTPEARTTATVAAAADAATEVTAAQRICYGRQSPPSISFLLALSLSQILALFNLPLFLSCIRLRRRNSRASHPIDLPP